MIASVTARRSRAGGRGIERSRPIRTRCRHRPVAIDAGPPCASAASSEIAGPGQPLRHPPQVRQHVLRALQLDAQEPEDVGRHVPEKRRPGARLTARPGMTASARPTNPDRAVRSSTSIHRPSRAPDRSSSPPAPSRAASRPKDESSVAAAIGGHRTPAAAVRFARPPAPGPASPARRPSVGPGPSPRRGGWCRCCRPWPPGPGPRRPARRPAPASGQIRPRQPVDTQARRGEGQHEDTRKSPADSPSGRVTRSRTSSEPRCGLNASNARTNGSSAKSRGSCRCSSSGSR